MQVLLLNAGSSSLKCSVLDSETRALVARASADWAGTVTRYEHTAPGEARRVEHVAFRSHEAAVARALGDLVKTKPVAVGHRIVHGGDLTGSVRVTDDVRARLAALAELAPLHNPPALETLATAQALLRDVPHVAVFDTAFHATLPEVARTYPVPHAWTEWGIRRYGFHGLSHAYCARRASELLGRRGLRLVICHLGHGCSATAVRDGRSIDTTMGFTPLDGLMMATRSGSLDPGILTYVQTHRGLTAADVDDALNHRAGLLGIAAISADMREVLAAAKRGHERSHLAIDVYVHRVRQAIGAFAVTLGGIDALVFTAGVGENSAEIRAAVCEPLGFLGLDLDAAANERCRPDADITRPDARARILVIATREDLAMLAEVLETIASPTRRTS